MDMPTIRRAPRTARPLAAARLRQLTYSLGHRVDGRPHGRDGSARCGAAPATSRGGRRSARSPRSRTASTSARSGSCSSSRRAGRCVTRYARISRRLRRVISAPERGGSSPHCPPSSAPAAPSARSRTRDTAVSTAVLSSAKLSPAASSPATITRSRPASRPSRGRTASRMRRRSRLRRTDERSPTSAKPTRATARSLAASWARTPAAEARTHRHGRRQSDVARAGDVARSPRRRGGQALAPLATPRLEHLASPRRRHADAKPVGLAPVLLLGLVGPFDVRRSRKREDRDRL